MSYDDRDARQSVEVTITNSHATRLRAEYESLSLTEALRTSSDEGLRSREGMLSEDDLRRVVQEELAARCSE